MKQDTMETDLIKILEYIGLPVHTIDDNRHYWFIRTQSGSYFDEFFLDGFVGIGHEDVPCVAESDRTDQLIDKIKDNHAQATRILNQVYKFCMEIKKDDIVVIPSKASAKFAFGYITDDTVYIENISSEDIDEGKCPFTRLRKVEWITGIEKNRVDSKLYTFFRNQQTLSQVDEYSEYIERAIHSFYIKSNIAHFTLSIETPYSPNAFDIPIFMCGILEKLNSISKELKRPISYDSIKSRTNVQSPGLIELLGEPYAICLLAVVMITIFGGKIKTKDISVETTGIYGILKLILDHLHGTEELKIKAEELKIKNPTTQKRAIGFLRTDNLINNQSSSHQQPRCDGNTDNPSSTEHK